MNTRLGTGWIRTFETTSKMLLKCRLQGWNGLKSWCLWKLIQKHWWMQFQVLDLLSEKWLKSQNKQLFNQCFNSEMILMKNQSESHQGKLKNIPHFNDQLKSECKEWQSNLNELMDLQDESQTVQNETRRKLIGLNLFFDNASFNQFLQSHWLRLSCLIGKYFQTFSVRINPCIEKKRLSIWLIWSSSSKENS